MFNKPTLFVVIVLILVGLAVNSGKFDNLINSLKSNSNSTQATLEPVCKEQESLAKVKSCTYLVQTNLGHGSGFYIPGGYIVTNRHVIEGASKIFTPKDDKDIPLTLWGYSKDEDLAVLKSPFEATSCEFTDSTKIPLAETLYAIGWPFSPEGESSITRGIYSRSLKAIEGPEFIQTDAAINPGNSGGPLVGKCGIVGINTAKISWSDPNTPTEGFGFAISSNTAKSIVSQLITEGKPTNLPVGKIRIKEYTPDYNYEYTNPQPTLTPKPKPSFNLRTEQGVKEYQDYLKDHFAEEVSGGFDSDADPNIQKPDITSINAQGGGKVQITWNAVPGADKYSMFYGPSSGGYNFMTSAGTATSHEIGGLPVGSTFYFVIQASVPNCPTGKWNNFCTSLKGKEASVVVK